MISRCISTSLIIFAAGFFLVACSAAPSDQTAALVAPESQLNNTTSPTPTAPIIEEERGVELEPQFWVEDVRRVDDQGAVVVEITPLNLNNPGQSLEFQVSLDTHSVDLSMDLAALSTLETDTGYTFKASQWDAPLGGHHVSGKLSFPALVQGTPLLTGVTKLKLTLVDLDAPERVFIWEK